MIKKILTQLPKWTLSVITTIAILWLTLAPKPLGDEPPQLFPGADKIVHGIMFGGLSIMMLLDWQRKNRWKPIWWTRAIGCAVISSIFGILIEYAQASMDVGRGMEEGDMLADTIGAFLFVIIWMFCQNFWVSNHYK